VATNAYKANIHNTHNSPLWTWISAKQRAEE